VASSGLIPQPLWIRYSPSCQRDCREAAGGEQWVFREILLRLPDFGGLPPSILRADRLALIGNQAGNSREPVPGILDPSFPEHMETMGSILPDHVDVGERPIIVLIGRCVEVQTDASIPRFDSAVDIMKSSQGVCVSLRLHPSLLSELRIDEGEALVSRLPVKPRVHLAYSPPERLATSGIPRRFRDSAHAWQHSPRNNA
jgi:hypothetical protein